MDNILNRKETLITTLMEKPAKIKAKPFLKWAGGKRQILHHLVSRLPSDIQNRVYREPFLGAGSLFFEINPKKAILSDANEHLINCFKHVRDNPALVSRYLQQHAQKDCERYYYQVRDIYNNSNFSTAQAARFIYLNKTCYNGIFRVNLNGLYNVPYGRYNTVSIPTPEHLRMVSKVLKSKKLTTASFEKTLEKVQKGDFIYLDPPYPPLNGTSCFTHYTIDKFNDKDQEKLASYVRELDTSGCLFMLSNAKTNKIKSLYKRFILKTLPVTRFITCKKVRHKVQELVITNYEVS